MIERQIEQYLVKRVKACNGLIYKFTSPSNRGVPDRIVIMPGGNVYFVECKSSTGKLSKLQSWVVSLFREHGCAVYIINSTEGVDEFIEAITASVSD